EQSLAGVESATALDRRAPAGVASRGRPAVREPLDRMASETGRGGGARGTGAGAPSRVRHRPVRAACVCDVSRPAVDRDLTARLAAPAAGFRLRRIDDTAGSPAERRRVRVSPDLRGLAARDNGEEPRPAAAAHMGEDGTRGPCRSARPPPRTY